MVGHVVGRARPNKPGRELVRAQCPASALLWRGKRDATHIFCVYVSKLVNEGGNLVKLWVFIGKFGKMGGVNGNEHKCRCTFWNCYCGLAKYP